MKLFPFYECAAEANETIKKGGTIFQQFQCAGCGVKQTIETPNAFHIKGKCEECGHITNMQLNGCNYLVIFGAGIDIAEMFSAIDRETKK